jgi:hypothetical protein
MNCCDSPWIIAVWAFCFVEDTILFHQNLIANHVNTETILCRCLPMEFLPEQPPPIEASANIYKLKTQPELVRYYHAAAGFSTKPKWVVAIKNRQFALWPGLTAKAVTKHFPKSEETTK